jgi:acetyl esterase/lipase
MKQFFYTAILAVLFTATAIAQSPQIGCGGGRYLTPNFFAATTTSTVMYGRNVTVSNVTKDLQATIYQPTGDNLAKRPLLVFAHGGSFVGGTPADVATYCQNFAKRGYVVASISYRLYDGPPFPLPDSTDFGDVVVRATHDMKAAIRFFRKDAATTNTYRIDPDFIFVGGESAGAILALHTAYISDLADVPPFIQGFLTSNGGLEGNTDHPTSSAMGYSSAVKGVISYYGGIYNTNIIDAGEVPIVSIHGTADNTVPYGFGMAKVGGIPIISINGSGNAHARATAQGIQNTLITVQGGGHGGFPAADYANMDVTAAAFYETLMCPFVATKDISYNQYVHIMPNPATDKLSINISEEVAAQGYSVQLLDVAGRIVNTITHTTAAQTSISRNAIAAGTYFVHIRFENQAAMPVNRKVVFE